MQLERIQDLVLTNGDNLGAHRFSSNNPYYDTKKSMGEISKAVKSLTTTAASQLAALISKVNRLEKSRPYEALECKVKELSSQLVQSLCKSLGENVRAPPSRHHATQIHLLHNHHNSNTLQNKTTKSLDSYKVTCAVRKKI